MTCWVDKLWCSGSNLTYRNGLVIMVTHVYMHLKVSLSLTSDINKQEQKLSVGEKMNAKVLVSSSYTPLAGLSF